MAVRAVKRYIGDYTDDYSDLYPEKAPPNGKKVAVIGAGPAGISCGIQLKRMGLEPFIFEKDEVGGLLWNANLVENYLGFPGGITGPDLVNVFKKQFQEHGLSIERETILEVSHNGDKFILRLEKEKKA